MGWEIALMIGYVGIAFLLVYIASALDEKNSPLKLLFLLIGLFILLLGITSAKTMLVSAGVSSVNLDGLLDVTYKGMIFITIFTVAYFIIYFMYVAVMKTLNAKKERDNV